MNNPQHISHFLPAALAGLLPPTIDADKITACGLTVSDLHKDVFNPNETDLEYFERRGRELKAVKNRSN